MNRRVRAWAVAGLLAYGGAWVSGAKAEANRRCRADAALQRVAATLVRRPPMGPQGLLKIVRDAGSDAPWVRTLRPASDDPRPVARWFADQRRRADAPLRCGFARGGDGGIWVVAAAGGHLEPVHPNQPRLRGTISPGFSLPELIWRDQDGFIRIPVEPGALGRGVPLPDGALFPAVVQLVATGPRGPRPVAERNVGAATWSAEPAGSAVASWLRRLRQRRGVSRLRPNRLLAQEARAHAGRVCRQRRVAHALSPGADPEQRVRARGLQARQVGEVIARAHSVTEAMGALERSPSHAWTLVDRRFTDRGFGSATGARGERCLVILFAAWPRFVGAPTR